MEYHVEFLQHSISPKELLVRLSDSHESCLYFTEARLLVWRDRVRRLATDQVVTRSSPATDLYVVYCWLISPYKFNLLSWLLAYLSDKYSAWHQLFNTWTLVDFIVHLTYLLKMRRCMLIDVS